MNTRPPLASLGLSTGKKARLHRILYRHGLGNGTALFLPYDQGLEHGPRDFFANPAAGDPRYIVRLAVEGGFNGIAIQIGLAEKFYWDFAGEVPLILKLNGKTDIPSDGFALSPLHASVEEAVRLGADAVGYTLYVGTPAQEQDFAPYMTVRRDAQRLGMPLIVWAYPRGDAVDATSPSRTSAPGCRSPTTPSSRARRRSTPSSPRRTARWCWSPAARRRATRPCSTRRRSRCRRARPG
jgi:fructose-bisphosphate aldolase, class I